MRERLARLLCPNLIRKLEADVESLTDAHEGLLTEKLLLQDRLSAALDDKEHLWSVMQAALDGERNALRMQVNHAVQKAGGGIPYPEAHSLPVTAVPQPRPAGYAGRGGRILPSEQAQRETRRFVVEQLLPRDGATA